jgi:site-specific DNA-methyltransferase (adenine-specific)
MARLIRVVAPVGGLVVDPFAGSGSTGVAAVQSGREFVGVERDPHHVETARRRIAEATQQFTLGGAA